MATAYFVETIERITEQQIEEEILNEVERIRTDANSKTEKIKESAIDEIESIKVDGVDEITDIRDKHLDYSTGEKCDMILKLADTGIRKNLKQIDSDTSAIYERITRVAHDTEVKIEKNIRTMIVNNGFSIDIENDGNGNVTVTMRRKA